ncbi:MAG: hypothetical protein CXZ00_15320 [Acidobacteria bacterium]|nr:MAG: hypothetical protein CXZ00_15320 [Acidobacteriota bacterium]
MNMFAFRAVVNCVCNQIGENLHKFGIDGVNSQFARHIDVEAKPLLRGCKFSCRHNIVRRVSQVDRGRLTSLAIVSEHLF